MRAVVALLATLLLVACASGPTQESRSAGDDPATGSAVDAMRTFVAATGDRDCEAMRSVVLTPSDFDCSSVDAYADLFGDLDPDDAEITESSRVDTSATVTVDWPEGPADFEVERVDGDWKIVLDSAA